MYARPRTGRVPVAARIVGARFAPPWRNIACAVPLALAILFLRPYLGGGIVPFGDDILLLNYPLLSLLAHALHDGYQLLWNPYSGGGYSLAPFSALPFYAPTWLLALLPVTSAMSWTYIFDLTIGGLGAYLLAARLDVGGARLVSAAVYPFSGFVLAHLYAGHFLEVGLICWLPMALAALHWAAEAPTVRLALWRGLVCGGPCGMLVLANGVSWLVFDAYPIGVVALALTWRAARPQRHRGLAGMARAAARPLGATATAGLVAALLGAVVLLPLREMVGLSVRGGALNYHAAARISEPLLGLGMTLAPGLFGSDATHSYWFPNSDAYFQEVYAYAGLLPLALALAGAVLGRRRPNVRLYAVLGVLGVVLALGVNTPLYGLIYGVLPGLDLARVPARWMMLAVLAVAVLAGVGAEALAGAARAAPSRRPLPRVRAVPLTLLALALLVVLGLLSGGLAALLPAAARHGVTIGPALARLLLVAVAGTLAVVVAAQLPKPAGAALLALVTVADLWTANGPLVQPLDPAPYYRSAAVTLAQRQTGRVWALDRSIPLRLGMLDGQTRDVQDYAPLTLLDYWLVMHPAKSLSSVDTGMARSIVGRYNQRVAALLGVTLVIAARPMHEAGFVPLTQLRVPHWGVLSGDWSHPGARPGPAYAYRATQSLAFAQPIYAVRAAQGRVPLAAVFAPGFDPRRVALLDGSAPPPATNPLLDAWRRSLTPAPCGANTNCASSAIIRLSTGPGATITSATVNALRLSVSMRHSGVLLLDQIYDMGWSATVDGRPAPVRRADYLLTAIPMDKGIHTVSLVFAPPSHLAGALLTLLGYVVWIGAALSMLVQAARRGYIAHGRLA